MTEREFAYNEIHPPIIEKQRIIDPCERSAFQLLEQFVRSEKMHQKLTDQLLRHTQIFFKKYFCRCI